MGFLGKLLDKRKKLKFNKEAMRSAQRLLEDKMSARGRVSHSFSLHKSPCVCTEPNILSQYLLCASVYCYQVYEASHLLAVLAYKF